VDDPFWLTLVIKMGASAAIVVAASVLVERSGPLVGAMIATLPISAGPSFAYLALEHGPEFVSQSALASLPATAATGIFILAYVALAQRGGLALSLAGAFAAWALAVFLVSRLVWSLPAAIALNAAVYTSGILATRRFLMHQPVKSAGRRWWDLPVRALAVMVLVAVVLLAGRMVGPQAAGFAALAPVVLTSLALIFHNRLGGPATASIMAHGLPGMLGFAAAILVLCLTVIPFGSAAALTGALMVSVGWNASLLILRPGGLRAMSPRPKRRC
jgi:hypothetical protein